MGSDTIDAVALFGSCYADARHGFRADAGDAAADLQSHVNDEAGHGPTGELLATDVARFGPPGAERVLFVLSGVHGKEGYAGSAVQRGWLAAGGPDRIGRGCAVVLIHAINPWGFAYGSRTTEGNVDLNRNFVDFSKPMPANPDYDALHPIFHTADADPITLNRAISALESARAWMGPKAFSNAMSRGQYSHRDGMMYGGTSPTWSNRTLRAIFAEHARGARSAGLIDLHTGIGDYGATVFICLHAPNSPAWERARGWWGPRAIDGSTLPSEHKVLADYAGTTFDAFASSAGPCEKTATVIEFGTLDRLSMRRALLVDRWMNTTGDRSSPEALALMRETVAASAPADPEWRTRVVASGVTVVEEAVAGIARD
ncbi:MAG: DUF2817 domain-containing protein [Alphaproteobacteria bacterium]|nr:DUF2817 domain-containing protein [Alphaproteobacteria bacterium]